MLRAQNLSKTYNDGTRALTDLNLQVNNGEIYCLLGANGAGKTTTINLFLNFIPPTHGSTVIDNIDVVQNPLEAKKHVAYVPENVMMYANLRASHNLEFFASIGGQGQLGRDDYYRVMKRVGLEEAVFERKVKHFSKGMLQKLALAAAVIKDAPNLLLDEPTSGLDPQAARNFIEILLSLKDEHRAILISTHDIFRAREIADRIGIMKSGRLVIEMRPDELEGKNIEQVYLKYMEDNPG